MQDRCERSSGCSIQVFMLLLCCAEHTRAQSQQLLLRFCLLLLVADAGDHDVLVCRVTQWQNLSSDTQPRVLYTDALRRAGLIS